MECITVEGGQRLEGTITINGAKNAALPLMTLGLMTDQALTLHRVPLVNDIFTMQEVLQKLGTDIHVFGNSFVLKTKELTSFKASYDHVRKMRASFLVLGALVGRYGRGEVSLPGGCAIGVRPINFHLEGLKALGATIDLQQGYVTAYAPPSGLPGGKYCFPLNSVTGTQNLLFASVLAKGESCLENAACEPEIEDLILCLKKMGAMIERKGSSTLYIQGQPSLSGTDYRVLPDRIEIGTYMIAAAITQGSLLLKGADIALMPTVKEVLEQAGALIRSSSDSIHITMNHRPYPFSFTTEPYPGFPTDLQAQFMALATLAQGESFITETIWENRFMHVSELMRMGADITMNGHQALVVGKKSLMGAPVMATDLRASVGLVLAALAAEGQSLIRRIYHLDRGYERIEEKLSACGAKINRLTSEPLSDELLVVGS